MSAPATAERDLERGHLELEDERATSEPRDGGGNGGDKPPEPPPERRGRGYGGERLPKWQRLLIWAVAILLGAMLSAALGWTIGGMFGKAAIAAEQLILEARGA